MEDPRVDLSRLTAIQDALRRRRPELVAELMASQPGLKLTAMAKRTLGNQEEDGSDTLVERLRIEGAQASDNMILPLARTLISEARKDLDDVLSQLFHRSRLLARIRLSAGMVSSVSTAGLLALIMGDQRPAQIAAAVIAFAAAMLGLFGAYFEDFSGGEGSTRKLRDLMTAQVRKLAEIEGRLRVAEALRDTGGVMDLLPSLNELFAEVQFARAQLGMAI